MNHQNEKLVSYTELRTMKVAKPVNRVDSPRLRTLPNVVQYSAECAGKCYNVKYRTNHYSFKCTQNRVCSAWFLYKGKQAFRTGVNINIGRK